MREKYPYLYETHLHTSDGSRCGKNTGVEMVAAAKAAGYAGIIITEHNWGGNTCVDRALSWEQWVEQFARGYYAAREYGQQIGLDVFWGYEAGFRGNDFLVYGITPAWLVAHPEIRHATVAEHNTMVRNAGGYVIHAHPFREASYIPQILQVPDLVDGVEGINGQHAHSAQSHIKKQYDEKAIAYANEHGLPITAGSDIHSVNLRGGGVAFKRKLASVEDYCKAVLGGEDYILTDGITVYDKYGKKIEEA